jgi:hemoglobin/transferrin/lactoferrin receptor protein
VLLLFKSRVYGMLFLLGFYLLGVLWGFIFGVLNLTDKNYWHWGESIIGRLATDPGLDRLSQPGLYAGISFRTEW